MNGMQSCDVVVPLNLDTCITGIFVPGNIGASSGQTPVVRPMPPSSTLAVTSAATVSNLENAALAHTLTANQVATWSIIGGADQAMFEISGSTLRWLSDGTQDFEVPADADADNAYVVTVRAEGVTALTVDQTVTVTVTDVAEVPPGFAASAMLMGTGPVAVNGDGVQRQAYVNGAMVNL